MKGSFRRKLRGPAGRRAFALIDVLMLAVVLGMIVAVHFPYYSRIREKSYVSIDQNNLRQILQASAIYASENDDRLAHPTWGADLTGPDGWAYLTSQKSRPVPGALSATPPSCSNRDVDSPQFTNQLAFFKMGQVTQYVPDVKTTWCPKDVATRGTGVSKQRWLARAVKVTSYVWNGTITGYVGPAPGNLNGRTYRISQFLPSDWQMWESNENDPFTFNDAAANPEVPQELLSFRHSGLKRWWTISGRIPRTIPGGGIVGSFDGAAKTVNFLRVYDMVNRRVPVPNELLNGPGYR